MKDKVKDFFLRKLIEPIKVQIRQGATPHGMALTVACGISISIFPLLGTTMLLCLIAGIVLKLNQPVLHAVNYVLYPLQLILIPVFLKLGAELTGSTPIVFDPILIIQEFSSDIGLFFQKYGMAGLHGVLAWCIIAPIITWISYHIVLRTFKKWKKTS
jgi:uncharacterized protein (DUF2062 family)